MSGFHVLVAVVLAATIFLGGCDQTNPASIRFDNSYYYGPDGEFQADKAKDAYIALMKYHGYPVWFRNIRIKPIFD